MRFDTFFSICQTPVNGYTPSDRVMFENFFSQALLADEIGIGTAWVAETHLSCQVQKKNPGAVIPHFEGEIGLNTDILQIAHLLFAKTKRLHVGSAIRNIQCNGGPIAHAEAIRMFLALHGLDKNEERLLDIGFASGRFPFSNMPYGIRPRNEFEKAAWPALKGKIFQQCTEIFLRLLKGEVLGSRDVAPIVVSRKDFRSDEEWQKAANHLPDRSKLAAEIAPFWSFDPVGLVPSEVNLRHLRLTIGAHDLETQLWANKFLPCGVFNLSITPSAQIEKTHEAMTKGFHKDGGTWTRNHMPRTVLVFHDPSAAKAKQKAQAAMETYWKAIEGTLDPEKVKNAVDNALVGDSAQIAEEAKRRFHQEDRLMLWFDFNNHDNEDVKRSMRAFMEEVAPRLS
jgi:alkanesulfonate monooxygenase SsuD/methylene tetrahydromethanopterin reductase-like flavin-dependent oxidoreductase (luciferase family)